MQAEHGPEFPGEGRPGPEGHPWPSGVWALLSAGRSPSFTHLPMLGAECAHPLPLRALWGEQGVGPSGLRAWEGVGEGTP